MAVHGFGDASTPGFGSFLALDDGVLQCGV